MATTMVSCQVSPTVLSSDLFTPLREPRVTLPTIGVHPRESPPNCPHPWGGPLTTYGGTGGLPFLGTCRIRDLPFGRSHRHFGSGLSYHPTAAQPYRLTALKLNDCRVNDQRLTAPLQAEGLRTVWQREAWPGHEPYFSHRSIFDVFPNGEYSEERANSSTFVDQSGGQMSETTRAALMRVREKLYQKTLYRDSYENKYIMTKPNAEDVTVIDRSEKGAVLFTDTADKQLDRISAFGSLRQSRQEGEDRNSDAGQENEEEENEDETEKTDDTEKSINRNEVDEYGDEVSYLLDRLFDDSIKRPSLPPTYLLSQREVHQPSPPVKCSPPPPPPTPDPQKYRRVSNIVDNKSKTPTLKPSPKPSLPARCSHEGEQLHQNPETEVRLDLTFSLGDPVPGVGPCWPPSTRHVIDRIRGSQLLEGREISDFPEAYFSTLKPRYIVPQLPSVGYRESDSLDYNRDIYQRCSATDGNQISNIPDSRSSQDKYELHLSEQRKFQPEVASAGRNGGAILFLPPVPLSKCLVPSGNNVPHRLGLRFKTEAQRRFHIVHPEEVPDLRSTKNFGKKYFFFDYHSSALRG